ncbi:hypothetical protein [Stutzerimonas chloritidismutans]|uniref:hypothetical protein n=1 Tax=Stutzerimonas chloritidismutans TaxID=203192 RepID=UPI001D1976C8|nr:hypothetical protein [Stutzerimonas chloritidismutans]UEG63240.1 hypothetical protein LLJ08_08945 [Stutzerimonas chloritidismutans]
MLIFNFPHAFSDQGAGVLSFVNEMGWLQVTQGEIGLIPPKDGSYHYIGDASGEFQVVALPGKRYLSRYNESEFIFESFGDPAVGKSFLLRIEVDEKYNMEAVVMKPTGEELYRAPYQHPKHLGTHHLALSSDTEWRIFNMTGQVVFSIIRPASSNNRGVARFSKPLFFFPLSPGEEYEVYDVEAERATGVRRFNGVILAVQDLPDGSVLVVDFAGIQRFQLVDGGIEVSPVLTFESAVGEETRVLTWVDDRNVYLAFDIYEAQSLLLLPLNGEPSQWLPFPTEWRIDGGTYGFKEGFNILPLARRYHTFDRAQLIWTPEEMLSQDSFHLDISDNIEIEQTASAVKGKHGYCIRVRDKSVNRAIRSAASELSRLIHESCDHPLGWDGNILDKKFDGQFRVEIYSADRPSEFEQRYLTKFVAEFREVLYFKPARSKASLAVEVVWGDLEQASVAFDPSNL